MSVMTKCAQVIPYFGKWPKWIDLYLFSCSKNPQLDFYFFTDCEIPTKIYPNTHFYQISFHDYNLLVQEKLNLSKGLNSPYKLTDLKPFLGIIHKDIFKNYEFWGFGDLDLIYGDLSMIVNENFLKKYDVITTHNYHIAGHFTLCRNNDYYRNLCFKIPDWQTLLTDNIHRGLDEGAWSNLIYPKLDWVKRFYKYIFRHFGFKFNFFMNKANAIIARNMHFKEYHTSLCPKPDEKWHFIYNGKKTQVIAPQNINLPYLHFLFFKKTHWLKTDNYWKDDFYKLKKPVHCINHILMSLEGIEEV